MTNERKQEIIETRENQENLELLQEKKQQLKSLLDSAEANKEILDGMGSKAQAALYQQIIDQAINELELVEKNIGELENQLNAVNTAEECHETNSTEGENSDPFRDYARQLSEHLQKGEYSGCAKVAQGMFLDLLADSGIDKYSVSNISLLTGNMFAVILRENLANRGGN